MDILTIIGLAIGFGAILGGQVLEGGHVGSILQGTAAIIVFGGTIGAILVNYPMSVFVHSLKLGATVFFDSKSNMREVIDKIVEFANITRREGLLALESHINKIDDPFFKKGLQLVTDGTESRVIREILELDLQNEEEMGEDAAKVYESAGAYAPTIGILGAVLGLIHVMENLAEPDKLGEGIAVAFVATVYGVGSANLLWLPAGGKIKLKIRKAAIMKELIIEGCVAIAEGENPRHIKGKLEGFLSRSERNK